MITSPLPYARYTCRLGATGMAEVRAPDGSGQAISGLPTHVLVDNF